MDQKEKALEKVAKQIAQCRECKKGKSGFPVAGEGNPHAAIMFIGEAPGKEEAKTGKPFVGRSGKLLTQFLEKIGIQRKDVFITSPVKYFPGRRVLTASEITHGRKHVREQIAIIEPTYIVLLGNTAIKALLGNRYTVTKMHGKIVRDNNQTYFITFHPAAVLRFPWKFTPFVTADFQKLKQLIKK